MFDADPLRGPNGESPCFAPCGKPECHQGCFRVTRTASAPPFLSIRERVEANLTENGWTHNETYGCWDNGDECESAIGRALDVQLARDKEGQS